MEADKQAIRRFFERLHGPEPQGWLIVWTRQDKATRAFDLGVEGMLDRAVEYCRSRASTADVYAAVGLQRERPANTSRGAEPGVASLPGFWADVDIAGPAHKADGLPPTEQAARELIDSAGLEPSIMVRSGFGLQPYWLLREPWQIESDDERQRLKSLSTRFQANLRIRANGHGWTVDSTADLCRVLRVPGTFNHKVPGDVRMVTAEYADRAYNLDDFEDLVAGSGAPTISEQSPSANCEVNVGVGMRETQVRRARHAHMPATTAPSLSQRCHLATQLAALRTSTQAARHNHHNRRNRHNRAPGPATRSRAGTDRPPA